MAVVAHKKELEVIDGTPEKRLFLSIISDYDLRTGLCELIDNALDLWVIDGKKRQLKIEVVLDAIRQLIVVTDNAGGVKEGQLRLLIAPGASRSRPNQEVIGIFGVGGKRAGVALGEHVEIRTRFKKEKSLQIDFTKEWLASDDWNLAAYQIPDIPPGTTTVDISKLRQSFDDHDVEAIRRHLGETYESFIQEGCQITLNGAPVVPISFDSWAYPPEFQPRQASFELVSSTGDEKIRVTITAGLIRDRQPEAENYGVYFYCNRRLIVKELRTRDVGYFISSEAGVPHPDASLCRVIVHLQGGAELMPWNSTKNGLNFSHSVFVQLRSRLIRLVSYYTSLSRRLKNDWEDNVFQYQAGSMETIDPEVVLSNRKISLPALPRSRRLSRVDEIKASNKKIIGDQPWTLGLVETLGLVDIITKQKLETKNRSALILLDSNFEIALKEFIVNRTDLFPPQVYNDAKIAALFNARHAVINEVKNKVNLTQVILQKVNHYYNLRNKLTHERATVGITNSQIEDYQKTVEQVLKILFKLKFPSD